MFTALEIYRPGLPSHVTQQGQAQKKESRYFFISVLDEKQVAQDAATLIAKLYAIHFRWVTLPLLSSVESQCWGLDVV